MTCRLCKKSIPDDAIYCPYCGHSVSPVRRTQRRYGNGEGTVYKRAGSFTARHVAYRAGKRYSSSKGGFKTRTDARKWLNANPLFIAAPSRMTVQEIYDAWSAVHYERITPKKKQAYEAAYKNCASIAPLYWDELNLDMLQKCVNKARDSHYQRKTVRTVLHQLEDYAYKNGVTVKKITSYIDIPPETKPVKKVFSKADVARLFNAYEGGDTFAGAVLIMLHTGMRYGEISTISPANIHLDESYLMGGIKTEAGKTGEIILLPSIKPIVAQLMIPTNTLSKMSDTTFRKRFDKTLSAAGCEPHTTHECRHTCATLLAEAGVQPAVIKEIMRHASYEQTLAYTHIDRNTKINALEKAFGTQSVISPGTGSQ